MRELKPCPFCGEKGKVYLRTTINETGFWVECVACGTSQRIRNREAAIEAWNTRADNIKYGYWIACNNNSGYKCSKCGARIKNSAQFNGNHKWCHQCGTKMIKK